MLRGAVACAAAAAGASAASSGSRRRQSSGLRYFRYHSALPHPAPAKQIYRDRESGSGWPEQCPPIKAAQAFGWDVINPFDIEFVYGEDGWGITSAVEVEGDDLRARTGAESFSQDNIWGWDPEQILPHKISPHVFPEIKHQVKVSTYLFLKTPPGWATLQTDIPNIERKFRVISALLDTDWYFPAHPWHLVIELPKGRRRQGESVQIQAGEPLCRLTPVRRGAYVADEMDSEELMENFAAGQQWLTDNGRPSDDPKAPAGALDIRGAYAKQQRTASFAVGEPPRGTGRASVNRGRARG